METKWPNIPAAAVATVLASLFGGGAMGSLITWYLNRPKPAIVTYTISTTTIADTNSTGSIVPNLKVQLGNEEIRALYAYTIEFTPSSGRYSDSAEVAITFSPDVRIYGPPLASAPSAVHHITCVPAASGAVCHFSPIKPGSASPFRVTFATDRKQAPTIDSAAKDIEFQTVAELAAPPGLLQGTEEHIGFALAFAVLIFSVYELVNVVRRRS